MQPLSILEKQIITIEEQALKRYSLNCSNLKQRNEIARFSAVFCISCAILFF